LAGSIWLLYSLVALIWGSTWWVITFQHGTVNPVISVVYRFAASSLLVFTWCFITRTNIRLPLKQHFFLAIQGSFLFGFNYWVLYIATQYLTTGLVAAIFSTMVFFNAFNARVLLNYPIRRPVIVGGFIGFLGVLLLFTKELMAFDFSGATGLGIALAFLATLVASLGNIAAAHNTQSNTPVMAINAWAMFYGTSVLAIIALVLGIPFTLDLRPSYLMALSYLVVLGSIVTFAGYLRLIKELGPDKAAYMSMLVPVIALTISAVFEDYRWTLPGTLGLVFILAGNWRAMHKRQGR